MQSNMQSPGISLRATISVRGCFFMSFFIAHKCRSPFALFFTVPHLPLSNLTSLPISPFADVRHNDNIKSNWVTHPLLPFPPQKNTSEVQLFKLQKKTRGFCVTVSSLSGSFILIVQTCSTNKKEGYLYLSNFIYVSFLLLTCFNKAFYYSQFKWPALSVTELHRHLYRYFTKKRYWYKRFK